MRWKRVAGYNVETGMRVTVPESSGNIIIPSGRIDMTWSDLLIVFDGFDPEFSKSPRTTAGHAGYIH